MSTPFIGQISFFPWSWAPYGWLPCNGSIYKIAEYQALYSLIGSNYGGDARNTFGVPNLQGLVPVGVGQSVGAQTNWTLGATHGTDTVLINNSMVPTHNHTMSFVLGASTTGTAVTDCMLANISPPQFWAAPPPANAYLGPAALTEAFGQAPSPHENRQPFLALYACIAWDGEYPDLDASGVTQQS
ncbi:tail fiber protein [Niveispirillum sp. BGYR6]|uniref:phage tail protein n=1 Tax=Niveispirillum sp. BGYR6 TaxID=2971249 RepID=UPI0022B9C870|nr:tail fiber protein [Niveispirillum sp. BGYR6]MDG5497363.1 tail fiber protein [Niveispirillum sp. BGYR6]